MTSNGMFVAAVQCVSTPDVAENLAKVRYWVAEASSQGAELVVLPEYFACMGAQDKDRVAVAEPLWHPSQGDTPAAPIQMALSAMARQHAITLAAGTVSIKPPAECGDESRSFNTLLVYGPNGELIDYYHKMHLFSFQKGQEQFDEAQSIIAGEQPMKFALNEFQVATGICFDLRFPELFRALLPFDVLILPAAFTYTTGQAHWEVLLRARAIENQCYVIASAQGGRHRNGRLTFGHSMLIDPWGEVIDALPEGEGLVMGRMERRVLEQVRAALPALSARRLGVPHNQHQRAS